MSQTSNIKVNMTFTANTQQAKAQMKDLQTTMSQLTSYINQQVGVKGLTQDLKESYQAAKFLETSLIRATNVNTGKLDLTKFQQSLKASGKSITEYGQMLAKVGPQGKQAFMQVSQSIVNAEVPLRKTNMLVDQLWTTLKNTAKWQLSANLLQGFTRSIRTAWNYAQDLNGSLNDIRIVTGYSVDKMSDFAKEANRAAKALSSTTNEYSKASLIYFQQGLSDQQVKERTDVTVKMANVTKDSAEIVSDQMTAVWNNFYNGSKSLEYYADVLTALGAATASSTDEIAQGLEKFAAVAETVGLSYEYASSALATVTATTRQSADVVGTAFKTLFARLQDLELGNTLDDGTTLGQYSKALEKVGINIMDASGGLKDMDIILDEMGSKWDSLSKAQQTALAQNVAGTRQYTQLVALMDNWDQFQQNLNTATTSEGSLQKQADIYAESWDAAEKRVQASAEAIYKQLLNDDFFIDLTNLFADLLDGIKLVVDAMGGVPGILSVIGMLIPKLFGDKILLSLKTTFDELSAHSKRARMEAQALKAEASKAASDMTVGWDLRGDQAQSDALKHRHQILNEIYKLNRELTPLEQQQVEAIMDGVDAWDQMAIAAAKAYDQADDKVSQVENDLQRVKNLLKSFDNNRIDKIQMDKEFNISSGYSKSLEKELQTNNFSDISIENTMDKLMLKYGMTTEQAKKYILILKKEIEAKKDKEGLTKEETKLEKEVIEARGRREKASEAMADTEKRANEETKKGILQAKGLSVAYQQLGTGIMNLVSGLSSFGMILNSFASITEIWKDDSLSGWEKFTRLLTSIGFILPSVSMAVKSFTAVETKSTLALLLNTIARLANNKAKTDGAIASDISEKEQEEETEAINKDSASRVVNNGIRKTTSKGKTYYFKEGQKGGRLSAAEGEKLFSAGSNSAGAAAGGGASGSGAAAGSGLGSAFMAALPVLAAVAIAVAAIGIGIWGIKTNIEATKKESESASNEAQRLTDNYQKVTEANQKFNDTLSNYQQGIDKLKGLTKGTVEYQQAVLEANEQAMALLETNKDLQYTVKDGVIQIDEDSLKIAQQKQLDRVREAQQAAMIGKSTALEKKNDLQQETFARKNLKTISDDPLMSGNEAISMGSGLAAGLAIGALGGPLGLAVGAIVGAMVGGIAGAITDEAVGTASDPETEALNKIADYVELNGNSMFANASEMERILKEELKIDDTNLVNELVKNRKALSENTSQLIANRTQADAAWTSALISELKDSSSVAEAQSQEFIANYLVDKGLKEKAENEWLDEFDKLLEGGDEDARDEYLKAVYGDEWQNYRIKNLGGTNWTIGKVNAETGSVDWEETNGLSQETARRNYAQAKAIESLAADSGSINEALAQLSILTTDLSNAGIINESQQNKILNNYRKDSEGNYNVNLNSMSGEEVLALAQNYLKISDSELKGAIEKAIQNYETNNPLYAMISSGQGEAASWYNSLTKAEKDLVWTLNIDKDATLDEIKQIFEDARVWWERQEVKLKISAADSLVELIEKGDYLKTGNFNELYEGLIKAGVVSESEIDSKTGELTTEAKIKYASMSQNELLRLANSSYSGAVGTQMGVLYDPNDQDYEAKAEERKQVLQKQIESLQKQLQEEYSDEKIQKDKQQQEKNIEEGLKSSSLQGYNSVWGNTDWSVYDNEEGKEQVEKTYSLLLGYLKELSIDENLIAARMTKIDFLKQYNSNKNAGTLTEFLIQFIPSTLENEKFQLDEELKQLQGKKDSISPESLMVEDAEIQGQTLAQIDKINKSLGLNTEEVNEYAQNLQDYALTSSEISDELAEDAVAAKQLASATMRLNKGVKDLTDNWEEWSKALSSSAGSPEYLEAMSQLKQVLANIFNTDTSAIADNDVLNNLELIKSAAQGDIDKIEELFALFSEQNKVKIIASFNQDGQLDTEEQTFIDFINGLQTFAYDNNIQMGAILTGEENSVITPFINMLNYLKQEMNYTNAQLQAIAASWNWGIYMDENGQVSAVQYLGTTRQRYNNIANKKDSGSSKDKKNLSDEIERYHEIDKTLERLNKEYDKLSAAKDRAFGKKRLDLIDQEIAKTKELAEATKSKLTEAENYFAQDRQAMVSKYGMSTDQYGNITNYDELVAAQVAAYNANPEGQEDAYNQFKEDLANYEESLGLLQDLQTELENYINDAIDKELEKIQYEVELKFELADMDLERLEWQIDNLTDSVGDLADKFRLLGESMEANIRKATASENAINQILAQGGLSLSDIQGKSSEDLSALLQGKNFTESQIKQLQTELSNLYDVTDAMEELQDSVSDELVAGFEDMNKEFDKSIDKLDHMTSMIDGYRNLIDLAGQDALGISNELMEQMGKTQYNIANSNIEITKAQLEQNQAALASLQSQIDAAEKAGDKAAVKELKEAYDEIYETVQDNEQSLLDATSAALEARTQLFETEMNNIIKTFEDAMTGAYGTFSAMQESFDQQQEINDRYIEDYEKIYELSKLNRDLVNSIDDTDSIRAKERLRDLQAEINALQESNTQMTQYEVDELRARYELRLAEIALEEAQNAKSTVRMQRDADGNWGYVYTADEAAVGDAQQNYEDKLYAYQQKLYEYTDEMEARMIAIPQEFAEAVQAIYEDQTLTDEERRLSIEETQEYYQGMYDYVVQELGRVTGDAKILYDEDWSAYSAATGYKLSSDTKWRDSFSETLAAQITGYTTLDEAQWDFKDRTDDMLTQLEERYTIYREDVKTTLDQALGDLENFVGDDNTDGSLAYYLKVAEDSAKDQANSAKKMGEENKLAFEKATQAASTNLTKYSSIVDSWNRKTQSISEALDGLITTYSELGLEIEDLATDYTILAAAKAAAGESSGGTSSTVTPVNHTYRAYGRVDLASTHSDDTSDYIKIKDSDISSKDTSSFSESGVTVVTTKDGKTYYINNSDLVSLNTGGYTGKWDNSGRIAMLHQKELVLNPADTVNFLSAMDILHDITRVIDLQALSHANVLHTLTSASVQPTTQVVEQDITIHAEFPNARERGEIEAAFDSLLNRASQFANRKNKW